MCCIKRVGGGGWGALARGRYPRHRTTPLAPKPTRQSRHARKPLPTPTHPTNPAARACRYGEWVARHGSASDALGEACRLALRYGQRYNAYLEGMGGQAALLGAWQAVTLVAFTRRSVCGCGGGGEGEVCGVGMGVGVCACSSPSQLCLRSASLLRLAECVRVWCVVLSPPPSTRTHTPLSQV